MKKGIYILIIAILFGGYGSAQTNKIQTKLSATEFLEKISKTKNAVIVDVRTPDEFQKGHIKNAFNLNIKSNEFDKQLATLDKKQPTFVYCLSGGRSSGAVDKMVKAGFTNITEMPGGMMEWRAKNLPEVAVKKAGEGMSLSKFNTLIKADNLVLVDFYADWCAPCKKMKPFIDKIAKEMTGKITLIRIDADANSALCKELNVAGLPVLKLYKNNKIVWENQGFTEESIVRQEIIKNK